MAQTATTGNLEAAQNIIVAKCRYTAEFNSPCVNLIEKFTLGKGAKSITVPKVGQMTVSALTDGIDIVAEQDIGLEYTELTTSEVGGRIVLTDKLMRQFNEDVFKIVGKQLGDAMARKRDTDVIALFSGLNGGTAYGADDKYMSMVNASACVANLKGGNKAPDPIVAVHHPHALSYLVRSAGAIGSTYYMGILGDYTAELLRNYWKINLDGCNFFQDGNIAAIAGSDSGYGAIFSKGAMAFVESKAPNVERERDASLRAWEVVIVADYGCFELDDNYGAAMRYEVASIATNA